MRPDTISNSIPTAASHGISNRGHKDDSREEAYRRIYTAAP